MFSLDLMLFSGRRLEEFGEIIQKEAGKGAVENQYSVSPDLSELAWTFISSLRVVTEINATTKTRRP